MKLVDTNVLVYATDRSAAHHEQARTWLEGALTRGERVLFPWLSLVGFIRIMTHRSIMSNPLTGDQAAEIVDQLLSAPGSVVAVPDRDHLGRMRELLVATATGGNIVNDAHLAAIALQYDASVVTFDNDFSRFAGVRWEAPGSE
jgi:toxin-antitoxin system PIN domain toxin